MQPSGGIDLRSGTALCTHKALHQRMRQGVGVGGCKLERKEDCGNDTRLVKKLC